MEAEYHAGKYTVEESNIRQFALVKASRDDVEDFVKSNLVVRDGFSDFVDYCQRSGIDLAVVSSGLDVYVNLTMSILGANYASHHAASTTFTQSGIELKYTSPTGSLITAGFKDSFVRHHKNQGRTVIYIGDGHSDIRPSGIADYTIARSSLADYLSQQNTPHDRFETFMDVQNYVECCKV
jgi:2-hydroxy-3-keto-5-methylthiopentenyl-1-phosphate phosphatase